MLVNNLIQSTKALIKPSAMATPLSLFNIPQQSIAYRYIPKRSPFDKTNYVDYYIPPQDKYHKSRKPRLSQWDDPNVHWPPILTRPTKLQGSELIRSIENREKHVRNALRPFPIPDVRAGDVIEFKYLFSISEHLGNILTGVVIGRKRIHSWNSSFRVLLRLAGEQIEMDFKEMSPLLIGMKIVARGSGNLRSKLYYLKHKELTREQFMRPILKKTMRRRREDAAKKQVTKGKNRNLRLEKIYDKTIDEAAYEETNMPKLL